MSDPQQVDAPEFKDWSIAAVRLLQGVVYCDDSRTWDIVLRSQSPLENYFSRLALQLVVDESEGYAYLRQWNANEYPAGYEDVPRLVTRRALGYGPSLLCVLLRDELRRFEEDDLQNERCVVQTDELLEQWRAFFPRGEDDMRLRKSLQAALGKIGDFGFIKKLGDNPEAWEIRRIIKARVPVTELENLRQQLVMQATGGAATESVQGDGHE